MSQRTDVLLWAQRILATAGAPAHQLLELKIDATIEQAQDSFHKIARTSHPDIHRSGLTPEELESVTLAYSRVAGAYQDFRSQRMQTGRMRPMKDPQPPSIRGVTPVPAATPTPSPTPTPVAAPARPASGASPTMNPATGSASTSMNSKALIYYRKAELALRRGDLKGAMLQMKMAIAGDPQSAFLRSALVEIETELAKSK